MITLKEVTISNIMYDVYLSSLEKPIYHVHYLQIMSKNLSGKLRHNTCYSKSGNLSSIRDYAERMSPNFNLEIQSKNLRTEEVYRSKNV